MATSISGKQFAPIVTRYTYLHVFLYTSLYVKQGLSSKLHICVRPHPNGSLGSRDSEGVWLSLVSRLPLVTR